MNAAPTDAGPGRPAGGEPSTLLVASALVVAGSVVVVAALTLLVHRGLGFGSLDGRVLHGFRHLKSPLALDSARALADLGNIEVLVLVAVLIGLLLRARRVHPVLCAVPLASLLLAGAFVQLMKETIPRSSPGAYWRFGPHVGSSFPSGHAADTTALAAGLAIVVVAVLLRRPAERLAVCALAAAVSVAVGLSRLVLGVHWPTDVLAGWAIGLATAVAIGTVAVLATQHFGLVPSPMDAEPVRSVR